MNYCAVGRLFAGRVLLLLLPLLPLPPVEKTTAVLFLLKAQIKNGRLC